jgi:TolC family type I secretion outer membrane protein
MGVVEAYAVLELSRNNAQVLRRQLDASNNRFEVGDVTRTDVAQSEARYARARSSVIESEGDLEAALAIFERVAGYRPQALPLQLPREIPPLPATLEETIDIALADSPRLEAAAHNIDAAENDIGVAAASLLPQVSLQGIMQRQDGAGVTGTSEYDTDRVTLNVSLPLYQNGAEYSRVRQSKLVARRRGFEETNTRQELISNTIQAWESLKTAIATIESQQETVRAAEVALEGVRQEQQYGARTILDVLDAEQELFNARVQLVRARRQRYVSAYNVLQIMGHLTPEVLNLGIESYDPEKHYDDVKWQLIGF